MRSVSAFKKIKALKWCQGILLQFNVIPFRWSGPVFLYPVRPTIERFLRIDDPRYSGGQLFSQIQDDLAYAALELVDVKRFGDAGSL